MVKEVESLNLCLPGVQVRLISRVWGPRLRNPRKRRSIGGVARSYGGVVAPARQVKLQLCFLVRANGSNSAALQSSRRGVIHGCARGRILSEDALTRSPKPANYICQLFTVDVNIISLISLIVKYRTVGLQCTLSTSPKRFQRTPFEIDMHSPVDILSMQQPFQAAI